MSIVYFDRERPALSNAELSEVSKWSEVNLRIMLGDFNADGWVD